MKPVSSGYAAVNGIKMYHELYGNGEPLVLIHGGLTTIGEMQGWVQPLAQTRRVIVVEMQGHGRTADTDRPMSFPTMGDDITALLDQLKIPKADLVGHSFGGASALRAAIQHRDKVRRLVVISSPSCITARERHELMRRPFTCTVQAPHWPWSQPFLVPVRWIDSRRQSRSVVRGSSDRSYERPLTCSETGMPASA